MQMPQSKQGALLHSFHPSASSLSHRSPLACHTLSLQPFSFCTWPMAVWGSLLHMNNNIWLFRQKPSDSAVSTVFITSSLLFSFFSLPQLQRTTFLSLLPLIFLLRWYHRLRFMAFISQQHIFHCLFFFFYCVHSPLKQKGQHCQQPCWQAVEWEGLQKDEE